MEKGLERVLDFLQQRQQLKGDVPNRHRQINKWLRENHPEITHYCYVLHVAKGSQILFSQEVRSSVKAKQL